MSAAERKERGRTELEKGNKNVCTKSYAVSVVCVVCCQQIVNKSMARRFTDALTCLLDVNQGTRHDAQTYSLCEITRRHVRAAAVNQA